MGFNMNIRIQIDSVYRKDLAEFWGECASRFYKDDEEAKERYLNVYCAILGSMRDKIFNVNLTHEEVSCMWNAFQENCRDDWKRCVKIHVLLIVVVKLMEKSVLV